MSCTVMYQPYAMSYSASSCDRTNNDKKSFKFPHAPSPPESTHSNASSAYSSPGSTGGGGSTLGAHNALLSSLSLLPPHIHSPSSALASVSAGSSHSNNGAGQRRPLTPSSSSSASATITSASQLHSHSHHSHSNNPHHSTSHHPHSNLHSHHQRSSSSATSTSASYPHNLSASASATATSSSRDLSHSNSASSSSTSSSNSSHHHQSGGGRTQGSSQQQQVGECSDDDSQNDPPQHQQRGDHHEREEGDGGESSRAQYLSANCILYVNYDGNTSRVVEEHFHKALSANPPKTLPMSTRNFPPSFWNSNYQPPPSAKAAALASYGAADFYGTAMDYSTAASISAGFPHHHPHAATADPWHYPLGTHHHHQGYHHHHHRPADITYPPMSSTSRFNAAQYGSFLFPSTSAAASRFPGIPTAAQCSAVKGDSTAAHVGHHWAAAAAGAARYDGWSDLHLAADYSAAAAAHYSNMTAAAGKAGLDFESNYLQSS